MPRAVGLSAVPWNAGPCPMNTTSGGGLGIGCEGLISVEPGLQLSLPSISTKLPRLNEPEPETPTYGLLYFSICVEAKTTGIVTPPTTTLSLIGIVVELNAIEALTVPPT